jgi:hypothetical protein
LTSDSEGYGLVTSGNERFKLVDHEEEFIGKKLTERDEEEVKKEDDDDEGPGGIRSW